MIPQGVAPTPCIPCCLVLTEKKLLTCHQDCQTSFFRSLGAADISDITAVCLEEEKEYCVIVRESRIFTPSPHLELLVNLISLEQSNQFTGNTSELVQAQSGVCSRCSCMSFIRQVWTHDSLTDVLYFLLSAYFFVNVGICSWSCSVPSSMGSLF